MHCTYLFFDRFSAALSLSLTLYKYYCKERRNITVVPVVKALHFQLVNPDSSSTATGDITKYIWPKLLPCSQKSPTLKTGTSEPLNFEGMHNVKKSFTFFHQYRRAFSCSFVHLFCCALS